MSPDKELAGLLSGIASYERAVGRAFLAQRSYSYASERSLPSESEESEFSVQSTPIIDTVKTGAIHQSPSLASLASGSPSIEFCTPDTIYSRRLSLLPVQLPRSQSDKRLSDMREPHTLPDMHDSQPFQQSMDYPRAPDFDGLMDHFDFDALGQLTADQIQPMGAGNMGTPAVHDGRCNRRSATTVASDLPTDDYSTEMGEAVEMTVVSVPDNYPSPKLPSPNHQRVRGWTAEADECIRREVDLQRRAGNGQIQWSQIASKVGDRNGVQCQARWAEVLDQSIRKGRWSATEDRLLRLGNRKYGSSWSKIAEVVQTRTQRQCRSRWLQLNSAVQLGQSQD